MTIRQGECHWNLGEGHWRASGETSGSATGASDKNVIGGGLEHWLFFLGGANGGGIRKGNTSKMKTAVLVNKKIGEDWDLNSFNNYSISLLSLDFPGVSSSEGWEVWKKLPTEISQVKLRVWWVWWFHRSRRLRRLWKFLSFLATKKTPRFWEDRSGPWYKMISCFLSPAAAYGCFQK